MEKKKEGILAMAKKSHTEKENKFESIHNFKDLKKTKPKLTCS